MPRRATVLIVLQAFAALMVNSACNADDLAKQSQNPIGNVVSLPIQNNYYPEMGPSDRAINSLSAQPVYPINFGKWNLINRAIIPLVYLEGQDEPVTGNPPNIGGGGPEAVFPGTSSEFGLGNITYQAFLSPAEPGEVIWGVGGVLGLPTATDKTLGADVWSAGPGIIVLSMPGNWVLGALAYNLWSVYEEGDEPETNNLVAQYFVNYNFGGGWYASSTPVITADWEADSDQRWTVPFGGGIGRLVRLGKTPVDFKGQVFYNAEKPAFVGDWSFQLQVKWLFPKT